MMFGLLALAMAVTADQPEIQYQAGDAALEICGVTADDPVKLIETILVLPATSFVEQTAEYLTLSQDKDMRLWTLVINDHPAAPAVICRTFKADGTGGTHLDMNISCFAEKPVCDKLASDFAAHNRQVIEKAEAE
jgi:hypothetical protein